MKLELKNDFLASHGIFKILSLVRKPKTFLLGVNNHPMLMPISNRTGKAPETRKRYLCCKMRRPDVYAYSLETLGDNCEIL